ncbi:MAG: MOSC domain-containing protein [Nitriliruptoraceae bacterium]
MERSTRELVETVPQRGRLDTILLRPERRGTPVAVRAVEVLAGLGPRGDHRTEGRRPDPSAKRQITLIQGEHLAVAAALLGRDHLDPALLRRNLVITGINLASLEDRRFLIGEVEFAGSGWCHPCSRMEEALGEGGFQAMRGHGGLTARVRTSGQLQVGDTVIALPGEDSGDDHDPDRARSSGHAD